MRDARFPTATFVTFDNDFTVLNIYIDTRFARALSRLGRVDANRHGAKEHGAN